MCGECGGSWERSGAKRCDGTTAPDPAPGSPSSSAKPPSSANTTPTNSSPTCRSAESVLVGRLRTENFSPSCCLQIDVELGDRLGVELGRASAAGQRDRLLEIVGALVVLVVDHDAAERLVAEEHLGIVVALRARHHADARRTEQALQIAVELLDLGDVHGHSSQRCCAERAAHHRNRDVSARCMAGSSGAKTALRAIWAARPA